MTTFYPIFCGKTFEVKPHRFGITCRHCLNVLRWNIACEKFDNDIGDFCSSERNFLIPPKTYLHALNQLLIYITVNFRADPLKTKQVINPQLNMDLVL